MNSPKALIALILLTCCAAGAEEPEWSALPYTTHAALQAVDSGGAGTFPLDTAIRIRGVLINHPSEMLPTAPNATPFLGGMWQVYVQAVNKGDWGGTACWMGQNIGKIVGTHPEGSYSAAEWLAEVDRLSHDAASGHAFAPGDLVEVRARAPGQFHAGKANINEQHATDPSQNFDLVLLEAGYGLPRPRVTPLWQVKNAADAFLFDPTRLTGCERAQGTLVRLNDVTFTSTDTWGPGANLLVTDGVRTIPVTLGVGDGFSLYPAPTGPVDLIGVFDQEDTNPIDGYRQGYRLWVMNYDGNGCILPTPFPIPGDANCDGVVDWRDIDPLVAGMNNNEPAWRATIGLPAACCPFSNVDVNADGSVDWRDIDPFVAAMNQ